MVWLPGKIPFSNATTDVVGSVTPFAILVHKYVNISVICRSFVCLVCTMACKESVKG